MTYGIIKNADGSTYVSPIFALKYAGWQSEAIVFDDTFEQIKKIKMWNTSSCEIKTNVFVIENDFNTDTEDWVGFDWVTQELLEALQQKEGVSIDIFPLFKDHTQKISLPDRFELITDKDIYSLENVSMGFHDSYIRGYTEADDDIVIRFDTTWGCYITVTFEEVTEADFKEKVGQILDSEIKKTDDGFTFTVIDGFAGWIDGCNYDADIGEPFIKCKRIFWQIEIV